MLTRSLFAFEAREYEQLQLDLVPGAGLEPALPLPEKGF
jgi:hypothetical protein